MDKTRNRPFTILAVALTLCFAWGRAIVFAMPAAVLAQTVPATPPATQAPAAPQPLPSPTFTVTVIETAPLPGVDLPIGKIPSPVQTATGADIEQSGALDLADFLNRRLNGVFVNEMQNNPFQPDVNYRGYTASPLLGTPQGLSIYMDGVRLNQPFGEVVSWDLIPRMAIASTTLMPGSNPLFGLNTLGGALSIQTKDGSNHARGRPSRRSTDPTRGARSSSSTAASRASSGFNWYVAGNLFTEDGWRDDSPSEVGQLFGKLGWQRRRPTRAVTVAYADNSLTGNGLQEQRFLDARLRQRLHQARRHRQPLDLREPHDAPQSRRTGPSFSRQRLLPPHPHQHVQRRHQRGLARSGGLSAECRGARGARRGRLHRRSRQRRRRLQHAVSVLALHRQRAAPGRARREVQRADQSRPHDAAQLRRLGPVHLRDCAPAAANQFTVGARVRRRAASASPSRPSSAISIRIAA